MDYAQFGLDGKLLGGENGEGVLIENIAFKFDTDVTTKEETVLIEIMGTAKTVMKDSWNPNAGYEDLPEPFPVKDMVKVVVASGKNSDNQIIYNTLNRQLNLDPPLVDDGDSWERFTKDGDNSIHDKVVGSKLFFRAKKAGTKTGEKLSEYFFNLVPIARREEAVKNAVKDKIGELLAKRKKEKEEKDAAMAAFTS